MQTLWTPGGEIDRLDFDALNARQQFALMRGLSGGMAAYEGLLNQPLLAAITNASFTGPTDITSTTTQPAYTMPAGTIYPGATIKTTAFGTFSTTGTPTAVVGPYWGSTVLGVNVALTTASGAATLPWHMETLSTFYGSGSSGSVTTQGFLRYGTTLTAVTIIPIPGIALVPVTGIDTTAAAVWSVKWTWSASSASNIVVTRGFFVELLNMPAA